MNKRAVCHVSCLSDVFEGRIDWSGYAPSSSAEEAPKESVQDKNGGSVRPNLTADEYADLATAAAADDAKDAESAHRTMTTIGSRKQWSLPHHAIQPYVRLLGIHPRLPLRRGSISRALVLLRQEIQLRNAPRNYFCGWRSIHPFLSVA